MRQEGLYRVDKQQQDETFKPSELLLIMSRVFLWTSLGMLALYFIVLAVEHKGEYLPLFKLTTNVHIPGYRVPIEDVEEAEETKRYHDIKSEEEDT